MMKPLKKLQFFTSAPYQCDYLPGQTSVTAFADPDAVMTTSLYSQLARMGFRRSGNHVYRPLCPNCQACIPTRISVHDFKPNRSQRRNHEANRHLTATLLPAHYRDESFELYRRYQKLRHTDGPMDNPTTQSFEEFLSCDWAESCLAEFREAGQLVSVAVIDFLQDGLSAVYTFFDPDLSQRGLGTYAILWQLEEATRRNLDYVYLGYWIEKNSKMNYKTHFQPIEGLISGAWQHLAKSN